MPAATAAKKASSKPAAKKRTAATPSKGTTGTPVEPTAGQIAAQAAEEQHDKAVAEKGYDPAIALEDRSQEEKDATMAEHAKPTNGKPVGGETSKASGKGKGTGTKRGKSAFDAACEVLRDSDGPMKVADLLVKIAERKSYTFSDAPTPPSTRLYVQLHAGIAKGKTVKVDKGTFDLAELNPKGAAKRPAAK